MPRTHLLAAALAAMFAPAAALAQPPAAEAEAPAAEPPRHSTPMPAPAAAQITRAADFVPLAAASNLFEIEASRLALETSQDLDIQAFARRMIEDHEQVGEALAQAVEASGAGLAIPAGLDPARQGMIEELRASSGAAFDTLYMQLQIQAHDEAVALFQGYARGGEAGPIRDFAEATLPVLLDHQEMAAGMQRA